jgi:dethiobiotin synthetase
MGFKVGVMKPFESGCQVAQSGLIPGDAVKLASVAFPTEEMDLICPYRFQSPLAPKVAAEIENVTIELSKVVQSFDSICTRHDLTLVEGAGGLLVPIFRKQTNADLARELGIPLLLVVSNRLGAINHTLLTLEVAKAHGIEVVGYILNQTDRARTVATETNHQTLQDITDVPCLGEIPFLKDGKDRAAFFKERLQLEKMTLQVSAKSTGPR